MHPSDLLDVVSARGTIGGAGDPLVVGNDASCREAREALRREQRVTLARRGPWEELPRDDLANSRRVVEHVPTGRTYRVHRGEILDVTYSPVSAYYLIGEDVVFLEARR